MKKIIIFWAVSLCMTLTLLSAIITQPANGIVNVGEIILFQTDCNSGLRTNWYWGDGSSTLSIPDSQKIWVNHFYKNPGNYNVHAHRVTMSTPPPCGLDTYGTVTVLENRLITISPALPAISQPIQFTAVNFQTPGDITWDMGDGTIYAHNRNIINHAYARAGSYTIRAFDWRGDTSTTPVTFTLVFVRSITFSPALPRVDQPVDIRAVGFTSDSINWSFGDGSPSQTYSAAVSHRYLSPGVFTITAQEQGSNLVLALDPVNKVITILPENRSLSLSPTSELMVGQLLTVTANNFRESLIRWNFGDGTVVSGPRVMTHVYQRPGNYLITARDENGASTVRIKTTARVMGISDEVNLEIAELTLDNGKYYKVVPKNSKDIRAQLRMKMRGTGIVSGYWIVDNQPYQFFNETVYQGLLKTIITPEIPGLPVFDPGMHTITVQLTRPEGEPVVFPILRYFVLPYENVIEILTPRDGAVIKEDQVAVFSWQRALGGSYYQISFANTLFPLLGDEAGLVWIDCPEQLNFTPDAMVWNAIQRNQWSYWKVRALDSNKTVVAESPVREMKIIIPGAEIGIQRITDMDGNSIALGQAFTAARNDTLLIQGQLTYPGDAEYLILRVYANDKLVDQLLFRDVKKDERKAFETSVPNLEKESLVIFEVLKSSSPSVVIGYAELKLKKE